MGDDFLMNAIPLKFKFMRHYQINLVDWIPANYGEPILKPEDFKFSRWAGKDKTNIFDQTPYVF